MIRDRRQGRRGLTLMELLVALTIGMVLMMIAVPSFIFIQDKQLEAQAVTALDRVELAQRAWLAKNATWASDPEALPPVRGLVLAVQASTGPIEVSVDVNGENELGLAVLSETGDCLARKIADPIEKTTTVNSIIPNSTACSGQAANTTLIIP